MPVGPSRRSRYSPPMCSHFGKDSSSFSTGNSQDGASASAAAGLGSEFDVGLVCPCVRFGDTLVLRRRASSSDLCVLIETITTSPLKVSVHFGPAQCGRLL